MKEAAGEANMTVITIILIAAIVAVATPLISNVMKTSQKRTCCLDAGGTYTGGKCTGGDTATYTECMGETTTGD